ncbi:MAG: hypothetical protein ACKPGK_05440 [Verrucomicrobiota bacterium]
MPAPWNYTTGETVRIGDVVRLGAWPGVVVDLVERPSSDSTGSSDDAGEGVLFEGPDFGRLLSATLGPDVRLVRRAPPG